MKNFDSSSYPIIILFCLFRFQLTQAFASLKSQTQRLSYINRHRCKNVHSHESCHISVPFVLQIGLLSLTFTDIIDCDQSISLVIDARWIYSTSLDSLPIGKRANDELIYSFLQTMLAYRCRTILSSW